MAGNSTESGRSVTSKITSILMTFTEGSEHSLTEIARLAKLPISTAHRLTAELTTWRLLERTPEGLYRAGLPLQMISNYPDRSPTLHERAPCVLEDLAGTTLQPVLLALTIAARSLSRELAGQPGEERTDAGRASGVSGQGSPWLARPSAEACS